MLFNAGQVITDQAQMAQEKKSADRQSFRRRRGFEAAASLMSQRVQKVAEGRGFAVSRLLTHWPEIAGESLAAITRPVRISHTRGGFGATLTLLTSGPSALMVEMQLPQLREKVNACYGYNAIQKIVLTQTAATGFAEGQARFEPALRRKVLPDPQAQAAAAEVGTRFSDPGLADAMARLALNVAMRKSS